MARRMYSLIHVFYTLHWTRTITRWVQPEAGQLISRGCLAAPLSLVMVLRRRYSSPDTESYRGLAWPLGWMVVVLRDLPCTNHWSIFWSIDQSQYYLHPDVAAAASGHLLAAPDLELEGDILPDDGVRLVGAEQHVGGLARGPRQASTEPVRCPFLREEK